MRAKSGWVGLVLLTALSGCKWVVSDAYVFDVADRDDDGHAAVLAGFDDCDDGNPNVYPGAPEICDNGIDDNCDGVVDDFGEGAITWWADNDFDGWGTDTLETRQACPDWLSGKAWTTQLGDCDDGDEAINPDVDDADCDGVDDDCDDVVDDEAPVLRKYLDLDNDLWGDPSEWVEGCDLSEFVGYVDAAGDCNDDDPEVHPGLVDDGCDGIDVDCDGMVDEDHPEIDTLWWVDDDGDGFGDEDDVTPIETCPALAPATHVADNTDCDDSDEYLNPDQPELCRDGVDNNCNGWIDAEDPTLADHYWFPDEDGDGYGDPASPQGYVFDCGPPAQHWVQDNTDCDDDEETVFPAQQVDFCDALDNDCDLMVDENAVFIDFYYDSDGDGYGDADISVTVCDFAPDDFVVFDPYYFPFDCDDNNVDANPGEVEVCNKFDDNCDGVNNEGIRELDWWPDYDSDGWGDESEAPEFACDGLQSAGFNVNVGGDCNDNDPNILPGQTEICDGVDQDCDLGVDEGLPVFDWWPDDDGDTRGDFWEPVFASCMGPMTDGMAPNNGDCDDNDSTIQLYRWALDYDEDGYRVDDPFVWLDQCPRPPDHSLLNLPYEWRDGDCADNDAAVHPGALEVCNDGVDNSCDLTDDCWLNQTVALADDASKTFEFIFPVSAQLGSSLLTIADQNSDGIDEILIGAPDLWTGSSTGAILYFQSPFSATNTAAGAIEIGGNLLGDGDLHFDDMNSDGIPDIVASEFNFPNSLNIFELPSADTHVHSSSSPPTYLTLFCDTLVQSISAPDVSVIGDHSLAVLCDNNTGNDELHLVYGPIVSDRNLGVQSDLYTLQTGLNLVISLGDVTGDQLTELGVAVEDASVVPAVSTFHVIEPRSSLLLNPVPFADLSIADISTTRLGGFHAAAVGDLDADGVQDLVLGVPLATSNSSLNAGTVFIVSGGVTGSGLDIETTPGVLEISGSLPGFEFGTSISVGDINLDGFDDLIVHAQVPAAQSVTYVHRGPFDFSATMTSADLETEIFGIDENENLVLADPADLTGDGVNDIVIGLPDAGLSGEVFVIEGRGL